MLLMMTNDTYSGTKLCAKMFEGENLWMTLTGMK